MESREWVYYANEDPISHLVSRGATVCSLGQVRERILIGDFHFHCKLPLKQKHLQTYSGLHPSLLDPLHI